MELSFDDINQTEILTEVEINPYYRYYTIFKDLLEPNKEENQEIVEIIHDLTIHHLKDIDILMGMNRREYHMNFLIKDMHEGFFGQYIKENIEILTKTEQKIVANNLLALHTTAECTHLFIDTVRRIFTRAYVLSNTETKDEVVFFLRTNETREKMAKLELIKYLFLPFKCNILIYWDKIFGVIGVPDLMRMDQIMNY